MCTRVIIDVNLFPSYFQPCMSMFKKWVDEGNGILVYTNDKRHKFHEEMSKHNKAHKYIMEKRRTSLHLVTREDVEKIEKTKSLASEKFKSNDKHILALALAGKVGILCTKDEALKKDFNKMNKVIGDKDLPPRSVYPHASKDRRKKQKFLDDNRCKK